MYMCSKAVMYNFIKQKLTYPLSCINLVCPFRQVKYECLSDEIKIGDYYLRLLLEEDENEENSVIKQS